MLRKGEVLAGITKLAKAARQLAKLIKRKLGVRTALVKIENRNKPIPAINDVVATPQRLLELSPKPTMSAAKNYPEILALQNQIFQLNQEVEANIDIIQANNDILEANNEILQANNAIIQANNAIIQALIDAQVAHLDRCSCCRILMTTQ